MEKCVQCPKNWSPFFLFLSGFSDFCPNEIGLITMIMYIMAFFINACPIATDMSANIASYRFSQKCKIDHFWHF